MNSYLFVLLVAAFGMSACVPQEQAAETVVEVELRSADDFAAAACPTVDSDGRINIAPGLTATILSEGSGRTASPTDYADVHTTLWLYDESTNDGRGLEIWSSGGVDPFQFQLGIGQVIKGWDMGVPCMRVGETRDLIVAGELGYGAAGRGQIPPNAALLFRIELVNLAALEQ